MRCSRPPSSTASPSRSTAIRRVRTSISRWPQRAQTVGCLFALDSDAHTTSQLVYAETALAHARLAGIPPDRIINCWTTERLLAWLRDRRAPASAP